LLSKYYPHLLQALAVAAGFVVLSTFAFGHSTANAIDFAISIAITVLGVVAVAVGRGKVERAIGLATVVLGAWSNARGLRAAAPQATVQVWPGMGDHPQRERPRQVAHFVEWHAAPAERRSSPRPALAA